MIKKFKHKIRRWKKKAMQSMHNTYFFVNKLPWPIKYGAGMICVLVWVASLPNPLLPGRLFLWVGLWIFFPASYHKLLWKYVKTKNFEEVVSYHSKWVFVILKAKYKFYFKRKFYKKLMLKKAKRNFKKWLLTTSINQFKKIEKQK